MLANKKYQAVAASPVKIGKLWHDDALFSGLHHFTATRKAVQAIERTSSEPLLASRLSRFTTVDVAESTTNLNQPAPPTQLRTGPVVGASSAASL
jgi:hypothetical protein